MLHGLHNSNATQILNLAQNCALQLLERMPKPHQLRIVSPLEKRLTLEVNILVLAGAQQRAQQLVRDVIVYLKCNWCSGHIYRKIESNNF